MRYPSSKVVVTMTENREPRSFDRRVDEALRDLYTAAMEFDWNAGPEEILGSSRHPRSTRVRRRASVVLVAIAIVVVFFVPFPHSSVFDRLSRQPNRNVPGSHKPSADKLAVVARLPKQFSFAYPPVLTSNGTKVVALLEPTGAGYGGSPLRLASIELPSGRVTVGPVVAGNTATLFTGSGQVFLLNLFGTPIGHVELWRVPNDLKPVLIARLPFTERTTTIAEFGPTNPAIAVAVVPNENEAWIADGNHILLMDLNTGYLILSRSVPSANDGNIWGLAIATRGGPLYATFCRNRPDNGECGTIAEINPIDGVVTSERWYYGAEQFGRYGVVATSAGAWLSAGGGGNGVWLHFFSSGQLRSAPVIDAVGQINILATAESVWSVVSGAGSSPGRLSCFSASPRGSIRRAAVNGWFTPRAVLLAQDPFAVWQGDRLLVTTDATILSTPIPKACETVSSTPSVKKAVDSTIQVLAQLPPKLYFDDSASPPVLVDGGNAVIAVVHPPLRVAEIQLTTGKITLGQRVAGIASLFIGASGHVFLANVSVASRGHVLLWRVSSDLRLTPLVRLPFAETTTKLGAPTDGAIAVAPVPNTDLVWVADGKHLELVDLDNGKLLASMSAPHGINGNVTSLAMPPDGSALYLTYCLPNRGQFPLDGCGTLAEMNPRTGAVIAQRLNLGPVWYGRYNLVATDQGAWYSGGGGANGAWLHFFSYPELHVFEVTAAIGSLWLHASRNEVFASLGGVGWPACATVGPKGAPRSTVFSLQLSKLRPRVPGWSYPLGLDPRGRLIFAVVGGGTAIPNRGILAISVPPACLSHA